MSSEEIEEYTALAERKGALFVLDVQLGRSTVVNEREALRPSMERPTFTSPWIPNTTLRREIPDVELSGVDVAEIKGAIEALDPTAARRFFR